MLRLDSLYRAARETGAQLSLTISVPLTNRQHPDHVADLPFPGPDTYTASTDYRSIWWYGSLYNFDRPQADVVRTLIATHEDGIEWVLESQLREAAGTTRPIAALFRDHPALGVVFDRCFDRPDAFRLLANS